MLINPMLCNSYVLLHTDAAEAVSWWFVQFNLASRVQLCLFPPLSMSMLPKLTQPLEHYMSW